MNDVAVLMLDIDWAPDYVIERIARMLIERRVKATWFVTHPAGALALLRRHADLFELGIHPNLNPGSSQGATMAEVVAHCLKIVPEAVSARSHGLTQSDYLWRHYLEATPIRCECSTYLGDIPRAYLSRFHWKGRELARLPCVFQDNLEMCAPESARDAAAMLARRAGVRSFSFHPLFIHMNSTRLDSGEALKRAGRPFQELTEEDIRPHIESGQGAGALFAGVVAQLARQGGGAWAREAAEL